MAHAADAEMRKDLVIRAGYAGVIVIAMVGWLWLLFDCVAWCLGF
jgi:hypothetical protein